MAVCDVCPQTATRFADQWFQFPRDPYRYTALCETCWDALLEQLERLASPAGRCPRCHTRLTQDAGCGACGFVCGSADRLSQAA